MKATRHDIYNAVIKRMVQEALAAKHQAFAMEHEQDTNEQLLCYIRSCAQKLGHSPHQMEIIGWPLILARFGTWHDALRLARLQLPQTPNIPSAFLITQEEEIVQKGIYREKKEQKKRQAEQRLAEQMRRKKAYSSEMKKAKENAKKQNNE